MQAFIYLQYLISRYKHCDDLDRYIVSYFFCNSTARLSKGMLPFRSHATKTMFDRWTIE
jgi:hypothetical protein